MLDDATEKDDNKSDSIKVVMFTSEQIHTLQTPMEY